jgi:hypothetical protein
MGVRLPTILGKAIDDVWKTLNQESDEDRIIDLVNCVHRMEDLMEDLQGNSKLRPIIDDGAGDIALWNKVSETVRPSGWVWHSTSQPLSPWRSSCGAAYQRGEGRGCNR